MLYIWGMGATMDGKSTGEGFSNGEPINFHINVLEMKAILLGLKAFANSLYNGRIRILSDNTPAVESVNKFCQNAGVTMAQVRLDAK